MRHAWGLHPLLCLLALVTSTWPAKAQYDFSAWVGTQSGQTEVLSGNGGAVTTLYDESGIFDNFFSAPDINDSGDVAFKAQPDTTGVQGLFVGNGGTPTALVDDSGPYLGFIGHAMNNVGDIVFGAIIDPGGGDPFQSRVYLARPQAAPKVPVLSGTGQVVVVGLVDGMKR